METSFDYVAFLARMERGEYVASDEWLSAFNGLTYREKIAYIAGQAHMRDRIITMFAQWEFEAAMHGSPSTKRDLREMQKTVSEMELMPPPSQTSTQS